MKAFPYYIMIAKTRAYQQTLPKDKKEQGELYFTPIERVLIEIISCCTTYEAEERNWASQDGIIHETGLEANVVRKCLCTLRGQGIIRLMPLVYEDGGYCGQAYKIYDLDPHSMREPHNQLTYDQLK